MPKMCYCETLNGGHAPKVCKALEAAKHEIQTIIDCLDLGECARLSDHLPGLKDALKQIQKAERG